MNYNPQNNLLSDYQKMNIPFQNNPLLANNPRYVSMTGERQSPLNQDISRYKNIQETKKQQKYNDIDRSLIHESVIRPIHIKRENKNDFLEKLKKLDSQWDNIKKNAWETRTNQPYKNILKGEKYDKFINKKTIEKEELIVHRVTDADKEGFREAVLELENNKQKHNNELKLIYSVSEEAKHKKKFEYNHREKYKVKYDPKNFNELKKDQYEYYKKEQEKIEKDKNDVMDILDNLLNNGMLDKEDIEKMEKEEGTMNSTSVKNVDTENGVRQINGSTKINSPSRIPTKENNVKVTVTQSHNVKESRCSKDVKSDTNRDSSDELCDLKKRYMDRQKKK